MSRNIGGNVNMVNTTIHCNGLKAVISGLLEDGATEQANAIISQMKHCVDDVNVTDTAISQDLPPLHIRGWNFAGAMARWAGEGFQRRTQDEIDERLAICQACPHLVNDHCSLCGCKCVATNQVVNKLALKGQECPIGKWK
jgi:hypothetical protein